MSGEIPTLVEELPVLPDELRKKIKKLKLRTPHQEIKNLIKELCAVQPLKLGQISIILGRHPKYVRENYLNDMVKAQELEHVFTNPNHPQQAYRTEKSCDNTSDAPFSECAKIRHRSDLGNNA